MEPHPETACKGPNRPPSFKSDRLISPSQSATGKPSYSARSMVYAEPRKMPQAVIVGAVRTPIGKRGGSLKDWRPDDLAAFVLRGLVDRAGIQPKIVEDVVMGCVTQIDEQGLNIGRIAPLIAGFPETVPGTSVNRMCASGLQALNFASMEVMTGQADVVVAAGVESM